MVERIRNEKCIGGFAVKGSGYKDLGFIWVSGFSGIWLKGVEGGRVQGLGFLRLE